MDAIGEVDLGLGRYDAAEPLLKRSLALRRRSFKLEARHPDLAKAQVALARSLLGQGRNDEAAGLLRTAHATFLALYGPDHDSTRQADALLNEVEKRPSKLSRSAGSP